MTAQSFERLLFEGKEYGMADEPLYFYLQKKKGYSIYSSYNRMLAGILWQLGD